VSHAVWDELLGQPEAIEQLQRAVANRQNGVQHAWLFTGPAGSGRSNLARSFAAALECSDGGCGNCQQCQLVMADAHPDVTMLQTDRVVISIDEIRKLVSRSSMGTNVGEYRVIVIEDADRMTERTSNVLLKVLEEPADKTIWILCAPSVADLLPTIRSRVRNINLRLPSIDEVTRILVERDGVDPAVARRSAIEAQNHVGMARRLAMSPDARSRRSETLRVLMSISNLSGAMVAAEKLLGVAKRDAESIALESDATEKESLMKAYGLDVGERVPPNLRSAFKDLEDNQKRKATRALRDGIDRIFTDMESVYRDVLSLQLGANTQLINEEISEDLAARAVGCASADSIAVLDAIALSRKRLGSNVRDLLVLESLCTKLIFRSQVAA
jgi:DNA polymerase III subunit delta'